MTVEDSQSFMFRESTGISIHHFEMNLEMVRGACRLSPVFVVVSGTRLPNGIL
jgi:hypothetical protein